MMDVETRRRFYAEEIAALAGLRSPRLVDALAAVPRERFLPPGPWTVRSEADMGAAPRQTPNADPAHVYHNYVVAIDASRHLFNGQPSLLALAIDRLNVGQGSRVLHVGTGLGYYTAVLGHAVGTTGRVLGVEVDEALARQARANLASMPWVEVRHGNASGALGEAFDAVLVNAGVTHPLPEWLAALAAGGSMMLPLTAPMPPMGATLGKGLMLQLTRTGDPEQLDVKVVSFVAIYSAQGIRDAALDEPIGRALAASPYARLARFRLDPHAPGETCWLHTPHGCFTTGPAPSAT